jgi:predicted Zn-ribbon and HTH transcriptional regulator
MKAFVLKSNLQISMVSFEECKHIHRGDEVQTKYGESLSIVPSVFIQSWCEKCGCGFSARTEVFREMPPCPKCCIDESWRYYITKEGT